LGQKRKRGSSYNRAISEKLKKLKELQTILQRSDIENAYVTNPSSETTSETVSNVIAEDVLGSLNRGRVSMKDFEFVGKGAAKRPIARKPRRAVKPRRSVKIKTSKRKSRKRVKVRHHQARKAKARRHSKRR